MLQQVRDFMTSTKNYLIKELNTGCCEEELSALEELVQQLLVAPLYDQLLRDQVDRLLRSGDVKALASSLRRHRRITLQQLGAQEGLIVPPEALARAVERLEDMLSLQTPVEKIRCLADATQEICRAMQSVKGVVVGGDDLLPLMSWVILQAGMVTAEAESEIMWYLLPEELQNGESGYYITTYWSAAHVVKSLDAELKKANASEDVPRRRKKRPTMQTSEGYWTDPEPCASDDEYDESADFTTDRRESTFTEHDTLLQDKIDKTTSELRRRKLQVSDKLVEFLLQNNCPCFMDLSINGPSKDYLQANLGCGACVHNRTTLLQSAGTIFSAVPVLTNTIMVA